MEIKIYSLRFPVFFQQSIREADMFSYQRGQDMQVEKLQNETGSLSSSSFAHIIWQGMEFEGKLFARGCSREGNQTKKKPKERFKEAVAPQVLETELSP